MKKINCAKCNALFTPKKKGEKLGPVCRRGNSVSKKEIKSILRKKSIDFASAKKVVSQKRLSRKVVERLLCSKDEDVLSVTLKHKSVPFDLLSKFKDTQSVKVKKIYEDKMGAFITKMNADTDKLVSKHADVKGKILFHI